jgi:anti-anti-sigma regulatory factor
MMLRITPIGPDPLAAVKLDGRLTGDHVTEVQRVCRAVKGRLILDLTDLQFADLQGVSALKELRAHGAEITGASPYIRLLLDGHEPDATP